MPTDTELTRLAEAGNALRPDWPARSLRAYLAREHRGRSFADLAVALAMVATDPATSTPARLGEHGPWWAATRHVVGRSEVPQVGPGRDVPRCERPGHEHEAADHCRACRAEELAGELGAASSGRLVRSPGLRPLVAQRSHVGPGLRALPDARSHRPETGAAS